MGAFLDESTKKGSLIWCMANAISSMCLPCSTLCPVPTPWVPGVTGLLNDQRSHPLTQQPRCQTGFCLGCIHKYQPSSHPGSTEGDMAESEFLSSLWMPWERCQYWSGKSTEGWSQHYLPSTKVPDQESYTLYIVNPGTWPRSTLAHRIPGMWCHLVLGAGSQRRWEASKQRFDGQTRLTF